MNWKRGLFRIWLVCTAAWLLLLVIFTWNDIIAPNTPSSRVFLTPQGFPSVADVTSGKWNPPDAKTFTAEEAIPAIEAAAPPSLSTTIPRLFNVLALGMILPMLTLIVGGAIRWAMRGFRTD
jgi:hypothetical protein